MTELLPNIYAIEVPMDSYDLEIIGATFGDTSITELWYTYDYDDVSEVISATENLEKSLQILGTVTTDKIDFDVSGLVNEFSTEQHSGYLVEGVWHSSSHRAFMWFLSSKGLDRDKKYVIIKKK